LGELQEKGQGRTENVETKQRGGNCLEKKREKHRDPKLQLRGKDIEKREAPEISKKIKKSCGIRKNQGL